MGDGLADLLLLDTQAAEDLVVDRVGVEAATVAAATATAGRCAREHRA